jgi:predicted nucleic acid-binding protein
MGFAARIREMRRVFADSGYWIGLRDKHDPWHQRSRKIAQWLVQNRCLVVVTPFLFAEVQGYFCRVPEIREMVIQDFWENRVLTIEQTTFEDQKRAVGILKKQRDKTYSFADAVSFVVMERLGLSEAISFDQHFAQYGKFMIIDGTNL